MEDTRERERDRRARGRSRLSHGGKRGPLFTRGDGQLVRHVLRMGYRHGVSHATVLFVSTYYGAGGLASRALAPAQLRAAWAAARGQLVPTGTFPTGVSGATTRLVLLLGHGRHGPSFASCPLPPAKARALEGLPAVRRPFAPLANVQCGPRHSSTSTPVVSRVGRC